jgi:PilZ domain-containing protein
MLTRARKLSSNRGTMSNGRSERRIARTVTVEVCLQEEPKLNERMLTENVSAHGARIFMERKLLPGQQVLVSSPKEGEHSQARIVYCQRVSERRFAVGLELSGRVESWAKSY